MAVVLDASLLVALAVDDARAPAVTTLLRDWLDESEELHSLTLLPYEVASGLTRLVAAGLFPSDRIEEAWQRLEAVPITYHSVRAYGPEVIDIALRLGRKSAHDAAYLALSEQLGAELWTFDGPLARNGLGVGFLVHLVQ